MFCAIFNALKNKEHTAERFLLILKSEMVDETELPVIMYVRVFYVSFYSHLKQCSFRFCQNRSLCYAITLDT